MPLHLRTALLAMLALGGTLTPACSKKATPTNIEARANAFFEAEDYDKARVEFMNLLRAQPGSPLAIKRLGLIWMEQGSPVQAYPFLTKAKELDPKDLAVLRKLAAVQFSIGKRDDVRQTVAAILAIAPADEEALLLLAESAATPEERTEVQKTLDALPDKDAGAARLARAAFLFRAGDLKAASTAADEAQKLLPNSMHVLLLQGNLATARKDPVAAKAAFKAAAELPGVRPVAQIRFADFLVRAGERAEAKAVLQALSAAKPSFLPAWDVQAQIALAERLPDEGLALCENIFARDPLNFSGRLLEAKFLMLKNQVQPAIEKLESLVKTYPGAPEIECQLARAYLVAGQVQPAMAALTRALTTQADFEEAILLQAEVNLRVGEARQAIVPLEELVKRRPGHPQAEPMLAEAYRRQGRLEDTIRIYRRRLNTNPKSVPQIILLGTALREAKQFAEARAEFAKALEIAPVTRVAIEQLLEMDVIDKKFDDARARIEPVLKENPDSAGGNFLLARIYAAEGKLTEAEAALQKSLKADPDSVQAAELFASVSLAGNKVPEAIAQLTALTARQPKLVGPHLTLGLIYEKTGQVEKARDAYEYILSLEPDNGPVLNNLAYLYLVRLNDPAKGYEAAKRARTLRPDDPAIADTFGWALYHRREYPQAVAALQEAVQKLETQPEVQYHLGMAHYAMGDTESARAALAKAVAAGGNFPGKEEAQSRLDLLASGGATQELSVEQLETLLKAQPHDIPVLLRLADAHEKNCAYAQAESALQRVLQENAQMVPALVKLARLYAGPLADGTKALATAKKARELGSADDPVIGALFGKAVYATGKASWAYSLLQESARRLPGEAAVQYDLACAAYASGKAVEAERILASLAQDNAKESVVKSDAQAFLAMLSLERERQDLPAAEPKIQALLSKDALFPPALMARAAVHVAKGEAPAAAAIYSSLLERLPEFASAQFRLAGLYAEDPARLSDAFTLAAKAKSALPDEPATSILLARLCYLKKDYAQTRTLLLKTAEKSKLDAASLFYLGMSQIQGGDAAKAKETLEQALAAELTEPMATEARKVLATLATN